MRAIVIALMALTLSACATVQKLDAAADVHALLVSIRDGDEATFDSLVDRKALKREIQQRLVSEAAKDDRVPAGLAAMSPDAFLCAMLDVDPDAVLDALVKQAAGYRKPATSLTALIEWLERVVPDFAAAVRGRSVGP